MIIDSENEIGVNEWNMEDENLNGSLQTKQNIVEEKTNPNEKNEMEKDLQTLHAHMKI